MWKKLSHEHVLSFRGVNMTLFRLALIYDWGQNGNINQYVASHPGASRASLVRKAQLLQRLQQITNFIFLTRGSCLASRRGCSTYTRSISHMGV